MPRHVRVFAASRLHFGLFTPAGGERRFGGVGAMVDAPGLRLSIHPASELAASGSLSDRALQFAHRWGEWNRQPVQCEIRVESAPAEHIGLGVGTQLGISVAAGLNAYYGLPAATPVELACSVGRGNRSAVGAHGFVLGGLIVERGKLKDEPLSPLDCRISLPDEWRFLLVRPDGIAGLSGEDEVSAFAQFSGDLHEHCDGLRREANEHLIPAAATADFEAFSASLYRYGHQAGLCFSEQQGGPYNGALLAGLVEWIRDLGGIGVGQTSWGPTLFVVCRSEDEARDLRRRIEGTWQAPSLSFTLAAPWNHPAIVEVFD
jgi:beta-ribofuranosylaminobenzene 5'-phosphate synthase